MYSEKSVSSQEPVIIPAELNHDKTRPRLILILLFIAAGFYNLLAQDPDSCMNHWETIINPGDEWSYLTDSSFQNSDWKLVTYNDSLWSKGRGGFGYGDNDDATTIPNCKVLCLRKKFTLHDTGMICRALLSIDYDDGFVAWLNGAEIARSGVIGELPDATSPVELHEAVMYAGGQPENFIIEKDSLGKYLLTGENLLSFQIHNQSLNSSDLSSIIYFSLAVSSAEQIYGPVADEITLPLSVATAYNIPLISIETKGQPITWGPKINAEMKIIHHGAGFYNHIQDSGNIYTGNIGIEIRGSSSGGFPQKSYSIETRDSIGENRNVSILNMSEENDWLLISNYFDRSLVRNSLSHDIFRGMGHYSPRSRHCEVVINGEYQGIYLLTEKIKADKGRVDIAKLGPYEYAGDDVTGGYIIKNDNYAGDGRDSWKIHFPAIREKGWDAVDARFVYVYPDWDTITDHQKSYIQGFIETSKNVLYGVDFTDPINGYYAYFDVESFVDYMLLSEVSRNGDAYKKSRFFYKDKDSRDGLLHAGPPWDFDWAWKNLFFQSKDGSGWVHNYEAYGYSDVQPVRYMNQMMQDKYFTSEIYNRYFNLREGVLHYDSLSYKIDSIANYLSDAQMRHFEQWDILNDQSGDPDSHVPDSYENEIVYLKEWIQLRLTWLDNNMMKLVKNDNTSVSAGESPSLLIRIFPNPASSIIYIESNESIHKTEVLTTYGNVLFSEEYEGNPSCSINLQSLNPGIYLVRITIQNRMIIRKILKL